MGMRRRGTGDSDGERAMGREIQGNGEEGAVTKRRRWSECL